MAGDGDVEVLFAQGSTKDDAALEASVTALQGYGFFDLSTPKVDAADLSVADLANYATK